MPAPDARLAREIDVYADAVRDVLGPRLVCCALHGSAAHDDFVPGRSDVNTVVVAEPLDAAALDALGPVARRFAPQGFALPLCLDPAFLRRAADVFPMELDDLARHHRVLAGRDVLSTIRVAPEAIRRQAEHEARGLVLRLRALVLAGDEMHAALEPPLLDGLRRHLVLLRHTVRLAGGDPGGRHADAIRRGPPGPAPRDAAAPRPSRACAARGPAGAGGAGARLARRGRAPRRGGRCARRLSARRGGGSRCWRSWRWSRRAASRRRRIRPSPPRAGS
jgi:hypothetical protein